MKRLHFIKKNPYLLMLIISTIALTIIGYSGKNTVYADYKVENLKVPQLVVVFEGAGERKYPWTVMGNSSNSTIPTNTVVVPNTAPDIIVDNKPEETDSPISADDKNAEVDHPNHDNHPNHNEHHGDHENHATDTVYQFQTVSEDYFKDALFIGDSRTVGLSEYSGLKGPSYYADEGMTIYDVFERKIVNLKGENITIPEALKLKSFKKIYIMLGINELGTGDTKRFVEQYKKVIAKLQELQPNSIIFVEGIMNVAKEKSNKDHIFNNVNIGKRNKGLSHIANKKDIFYINVNEAIADKEGNIPTQYTFDSIHLKAAYYKLWVDFLIKHGVE